jgi:hypothetical protein
VAEAVILSHSSFVAFGSYEEIPSGKSYEGDFLCIVGEIQNVGEVGLNSILVSATFYDANDAVIEGHPHALIEPLTILTPNARCPFEVILVDEEASARVARYELSLDYTETDEEPPKLTFIQESAYMGTGRNFWVLGEIENPG